MALLPNSATAMHVHMMSNLVIKDIDEWRTTTFPSSHILAGMKG